MRYGVIDLGSNTVRLVVFQYYKGQLKKIHTKREVFGLASYLLPEGFMSDLGIRQAIKSINELKLEASDYSVSKLFVFATASIRNAKNQNEILNRIKNKTGEQVKLLSALEEARLGVIATKYERDFSDGIVIDLGGGSTEVSIIKDSKITNSASLPIGSLNSYVTFVKEMLPNKDEIVNINKVVVSALKESGLKQTSKSIIYGMGGTAKSAKNLIELIRNKKVNYLTINDVNELISKIDPNKKITFLHLIRVIPERFHTIVPGLVILKTLMEYFNCEKLYVNNYSIREGFMLSILDK